MILRRIAEAIRARDWFTFSIEFAIVVAGVFIGLQVQQWADAQRQARVERSYTERLQAEVLNLMATRAPLVEVRDRRNEALATVTQAIYDDELRTLGDFECTSIVYTFAVSNPTDDLAALLELQSTGQLSAFSNPRVLEALGAFQLARARARDAHAGIFRTQLILHLRHPDLVQVTAPADVATSPPDWGSFRCDLDGMRASPQFRNDFDLNRNNYTQHALLNARVDASLRALNQVLMDVLGQPREVAAP